MRYHPPIQDGRRARRAGLRLWMATLLLAACQSEAKPSTSPVMSSMAPTPTLDGPLTATEPTVTTALDIREPATPMPTTIGMPAPTAAGNLQVDLAQSKDLPLELVQAAHDFTGLYSEVFNASYLGTADLNGNGQTDILVALDHATCAATSGWPCLTAVEWDGAAYAARAVVARPLVGVDPGFRPERYEGYLTTSTSDTGAVRVWLSISGHADLPASGLFALVGDSDSASLAVESFTPLLRAPQALWALADGQGRSGVLAVTWDTAVTFLTNVNTVQWITEGGSNVDLWSKDSTALLYAGTLPGLDGTYLLQEHIFTTRANDLVAYRLEGQDRQPVENPLPVNGSLKGVYRGRSVLGPTNLDSLVLLRTETRCALGNPHLCALDVDPVMGDQAVDYIEVYDRVEGRRLCVAGARPGRPRTAARLSVDAGRSGR